MRERGRNREDMKDEEENSSVSSQNRTVLRIQDRTKQVTSLLEGTSHPVGFKYSKTM